MESESGMAGHVGKEARDKVWASVRTYEGANKRGALGSGLQPCPVMPSSPRWAAKLSKHALLAAPGACTAHTHPC